MERQRQLDHLCKTLDEAIACAEEAGLEFVAHILDVARLEVVRTSESNVITMPTARSFGKRS